MEAPPFSRIAPAGAIREKGGASIEAECSSHAAIGLGESAVTGGGDLSVRFVIHAAVMEPGGVANEVSVRSAVQSSLRAASGLGCRNVALPAGRATFLQPKPDAARKLL